MSSNPFFRSLIQISLVAVFSLAFFSHTAFATSTKIFVSPSPVTLSADGGVQDFSIQLIQPIITFLPQTPYLTLTISTTNPTVHISTTTIAYTGDDWSEPKQFTVMTRGHASGVATINLTAVSNSEFYNGYVAHAQITLTGDAVPSTPPVSSPVTTLIIYGCKDPAATNFNPNPIAAQNDLCVFPQKTETSVAPAVPSDLFATNLKKGMNAPDVLRLQKFLNAHGSLVAQTGSGSPGNEVSFFGTKTVLALMKYQQANGITPATGYFGSITRALVNSVLEAGK